MTLSELQQRVDELVQKLRRVGTDLQEVEVKTAAGGLPRTTIESISAFANTAGGLLILGLDEAAGFAVAEIDAARIAADLGAAAADQLEPPIRDAVHVLEVDGRPVVVMEVNELSPSLKPCYVKTKGIERGSFVRVHDGDRTLTSYEVHILLSSRGQPREDMSPVPGAGLDALDESMLRGLVERLKQNRGAIFSNTTDDQIRQMMGITVRTDEGEAVTVAGLLALGKYPQQYFPQLNVTFVSYPTIDGSPLVDGTRFLDNQSVDGSIPVMVAQALERVRKNMKRRSIIVGLGREDRWEYPEEAIRELIANALIHRDYHPLAHGAQVRIEMYPDRIKITNPGGLHGPVAQEILGSEPVSSSRNAKLAKLLEDVEVPGTGRTVCENRGSGLVAAVASLRGAGVEPPEFANNVREFSAVVRNHSLMDEQALAWLSTIDIVGLDDRQRLGLAFTHRNGRITNQQYRTLTGTDALTATRDLTDLAARGLVTKSNDRRWAVWTLAGDVERAGPEQSSLDLETDSQPAQPSRRGDRRDAIRQLLATGPKSARQLASHLKISREGVLQWIRKMEAAGEVEPTAPRSSRKNEWRLREPS